MSSLLFCFVYFTLDDVYKVKAVFIVVLDRTTEQHIGRSGYAQNKWNVMKKSDQGSKQCIKNFVGSFI